MIIFSKKEKAFLILIGVLIFLNFFVWQEVFDLTDTRLKVVFFDVGQGDSIFIKTDQNHQILIDGGPGNVLLEKIEKEMAPWDREIDLVILTHPEKDHIEGLIEVLKRYKIKNILWTGVKRETAQYKAWENILKEREFKTKIASAGQRIKAGNVQIDIFHPFENKKGKDIKNSNDTSIVSQMTFGRNSFLFTGDITEKVEIELTEKRIDLNSEVLKVAHHGSKYSSHQRFIEAVSPVIAVIQSGENSYGHPTPETLQRLEKSAIYVLRTDKLGDIKILSDGNNLQIEE